MARSRRKPSRAARFSKYGENLRFPRVLPATIGRRLEVARWVTAGVNPAYRPRVVGRTLRFVSPQQVDGRGISAVRQPILSTPPTELTPSLSSRTPPPYPPHPV